MIAFDATSTGTGTATSLTVAHTCTGQDRLLVVAATNHASSLVTNIKYNGTLMTKVIDGGGLGNNIGLYYLLNPDTGTNNIVLTESVSDVLAIMAVSYTGVQQASAIDGYPGVNESDQVSPFDQTITSNNYGSLMVFAAADNHVAANARTINQGNKRHDIATSISGGFFGDIVTTNAGITTLSYTDASVTECITAAAAFSAVSTDRMTKSIYLSQGFQ